MKTTLGKLAKLFATTSVLIVLGCSSTPKVTEQQADVDYDLLFGMPAQPVNFETQVRPVTDRRCVVCHGCYDAPCQLKLSSYEGMQRGGNTTRVYDGARIQAIEPSRLGIDAKTTGEWRTRGFHPVLPEAISESPRENLEQSIMYQLLRMKQRHPQPRVGMLPDDVDVTLDRAQVCASNAGFAELEQKHPLWGMPYGLPNLSEEEYATLVWWLAQGAPGPQPIKISDQSARQIQDWERFLNQPDNRQRLVSRYIFEHLPQAHIHFEGAPVNEFFRLVRSPAPPGSPVDEIASVRPYDDPGGEFYYRLLPYEASRVLKTHSVYNWSPGRMKRYRELFLDPDYTVDELPGYDAGLSANPFKVFEAIPPISRYKFLLDDAHFFIEGFIKGPVCRGQIALNVIEDQFWVFFLQPRDQSATLQPDFINASVDYLNLPSEQGDDSLRVITTWLDYLERQRKYLASKNLFLEDYFNSEQKVIDIHKGVELIWDGEGSNRNAGLTVFRHFDSASVTHGLVGDYPETAWVIDYPLFERIHYLLVAGFNIYGNLTHQLTTRLYMDFLRMEAENQFLLFLPMEQRKAIRDGWYQGLHENVWNDFDNAFAVTMELDTVKGYEQEDTQRELYGLMMQRLGKSIAGQDPINRCHDECEAKGSTASQEADRMMRRIAAKKGDSLIVFPDVSFVRVKIPEGEDLVYTLILNKGYSNITSMFESEEQRDRSQDSLTVVRGLQGAYPNFFFSVDRDQLEEFVQAIESVTDRDDYERFVGRFGIRRTNTRFWAESDWYHDWIQANDPVNAGLLDYNRYRNR
ncbi:MAG: fatty acid cis/trans isomerase [Candidatus Thiodiazotropha sp.]